MIDIDLNIENHLEPEKGRLLISEPFLEDEYFKRSVILLCEHNEEGSFGFVLNNYLDATIYEIVEDFPEIQSKVSIGGPVNTEHVYYIHTLGEEVPGSIKVIDNVYMGGEFEMIKEMISTGKILENDIRFFIGYSGWSENQLEEELKQKAWVVSNTTQKEVMNTSIDKLWKKTMARQKGSKYKIISSFPDNFRLN